ncbi:MAG TPA: hypothetical protein EYP62_07835 [Kiritimatiellae bacterium]|nr:hypothetical protein [Kiritimatiellia bacterium]
MRSRKVLSVMVLLFIPCILRAAVPEPTFELWERGVPEMIPYEEYGYFTNEGTVAFSYIVTNEVGLAIASGEGVDPNRSVYDDPAYERMKKGGKLKGDPWKHVLTPHHQRDFFIWADASEDAGVRQFFQAKILYRAGHVIQALKGFYAAMMFYPQSEGWSEAGNFTWSVAEAALKEIKNILKEHPEVGWRLDGAKVEVRNQNIRKQILVTPGKWVCVKTERSETAPREPVPEGGPSFELYDPGIDRPVPYPEFGYFTNEGTYQFAYVITDRVGLAEASGEFVDPNRSVYEDPAYLEARKEGKLDVEDHWKHTQTPNHQLDLFIWADAPEDAGVRQFFLGQILERAGHYMQALKAYHASMVLYPASVCWSSGGEFEWSIAEAAWHAIENLTREHPELGWKLAGADVTTFVDQSGMKVAVCPGNFERLESLPRKVPASETGEAYRVLERLKIVGKRGEGKVRFVKYENGHWQMLVDNEPYFIKGVTYAPTMVGRLPWKWEWMWADENTNGFVDALEAWVDRNRNGIRDYDEPVVGDFHLLREMGCNTIRFYYTNEEVNVLLLRRMFNEHGIRAILGDFLGAYCHGSGATWEEGTDYTDPEQRKRMLAAVEAKVLRCRHEPWLLMYVLGNENNMPSTEDVNTTRTNAGSHPEAYARFLNEVAALIHRLDPDHPVGVGNLMTGLIDYYAKYAPGLDYIGINAYIGPHGFGAMWEKVSKRMDRPVLITEFGCDSYWTGRGVDEQAQADYILGCWADIWYHRAGGPGVGNSIGGCVFEWLDEWWKDTRNYFQDPIDHQSIEATVGMAFPDGASQEEWLGIVSQGDGRASPFLRIPKKAYYELQRGWRR